jgi:hypothetical protein
VLELALYDHQRSAFPRHLDSVRVPELMRGKPTSNARLSRSRA